MNIKHYELLQKPALAWFGYKRFGCPEAVREDLRRESFTAHEQGYISERELEVDCFLSIVANLDKKTVYLMECGSGWGEWCLALAGIIRNKIISTKVVDFVAFGIECDSRFYEVMKRNFRSLALSAWPIHGAVSNHNGGGYFNTGFISKNRCGGSTAFDGTFKGSKLIGKILGAANIVNRSLEYVRFFTVDSLLNQYDVPELDILHVDVQGGETLVLEGAKSHLDRIDHMIIGTHANNLHRQVKAILSDTHDVVVEALPGRVNYIEGIPPVLILKGQDGLILFRRHGL